MNRMLFLVLLVRLAAASAATITVNGTADNTAAQDGMCTLREAIANVNAQGDTSSGDCAAGTGTGDTIGFDLALPATITLTMNAELAISADVTVSGPSGGGLVIDGNQQARVFAITAGTVHLAHLTIQNGRTFSFGGGVYNNGHATLSNCILSTNFAGLGGGGLVNDGTMALSDCTLTGNTGGKSGGGLANSGNLTLANCRLIDNSAEDGSAGGLYNDGTATLTNCTLSGNSVTIKGNGGAVYNGGTATLGGCTLSGNSAGKSGGAVYNEGSAMLTNCTLSGNAAAKDGGGLASGSGALTIINSTFTDNGANRGGGIAMLAGTAQLANSIVANSPMGGNCFGSITDGGHNLDDGTSCGFSAVGSSSGTDARLDPAGLEDNGGATETVALCDSEGIPAGCTGTSPAADAGDPSVCAAAPVNNLDQRGFRRPGSGQTSCSIGAYEGGGTAPAVCIGDCDADGSVTSGEILMMVNIALGNASPATCARGVASRAEIDVALLVQAVNNGVDGCSTQP